MNPAFWTPANADSAAINDAIALAAAAGGGKVILPPAVYDTSPGKIIMAPYVALEGCGPATILQMTSALDDYLIDGGFAGGGANPAHHSGVSHLVIDMGSFDAPDGSNGAIFQSGPGCWLDDVEILNCGRYGAWAQTGATGLEGLRWNNVRVFRSAPPIPNGGVQIGMNIAPYIDTSGSNTGTNIAMKITDCYTVGTCQDFSAYRSIFSRLISRNAGFGSGLTFNGSTVTGNDMFNIIANCIACNGAGTGIENWATFTTIFGCHALGNAGAGIACGASDCSILGCHAEGNQQGGIALLVAGANAAARCLLDGCKTSSNTGPAFSAAPSLGSNYILGSNDFR